MKNLYLVRGLPGSGKSTLANTLAQGQEYLVCEADKYFIDKETGEYKFDVSKIKDAHESCRATVEMYMHDSTINNQFYETIVVSNTFTQEWEMKAYYELAEKYGYRVTSIIVENRHDGKNIHGVPDDKLEIMKNRFDVKLM
jgi:predicted kinase